MDATNTGQSGRRRQEKRPRRQRSASTKKLIIFFGRRFSVITVTIGCQNFGQRPVAQNLITSLNENADSFQIGAVIFAKIVVHNGAKRAHAEQIQQDGNNVKKIKIHGPATNRNFVHKKDRLTIRCRNKNLSDLDSKPFNCKNVTQVHSIICKIDANKQWSTSSAAPKRVQKFDKNLTIRMFLNSNSSRQSPAMLQVEADRFPSKSLATKVLVIEHSPSSEESWKMDSLYELSSKTLFHLIKNSTNSKESGIIR
uniref:Uncharacterized protein n=1 Tax=Romanomermis culicivorax TaxID=13658 RepID=A0A915KFU3_ROMCU